MKRLWINGKVSVDRDCERDDKDESSQDERIQEQRRRTMGVGREGKDIKITDDRGPQGTWEDDEEQSTWSE